MAHRRRERTVTIHLVAIAAAPAAAFALLSAQPGRQGRGHGGRRPMSERRSGSPSRCRRGARRVAGAILSLAVVSALLAVGTAPAGATTISVADEAEFRAALATLGGDPNGPHVIEVTADIDLAGATTPGLGDASGTPLTINGNGNTIDAKDNSGVLDTDADVVMNDLVVTGARGVSAVHTAFSVVTINRTTFVANGPAQAGGAVLSGEPRRLGDSRQHLRGQQRVVYRWRGGHRYRRSDREQHLRGQQRVIDRWCDRACRKPVQPSSHPRPRHRDGELGARRGEPEIQLPRPVRELRLGRRPAGGRRIQLR